MKICIKYKDFHIYFPNTDNKDDHLEGNLGCQEMSEPCERDGTLDCCEGLNCQVYSNRCF